MFTAEVVRRAHQIGNDHRLYQIINVYVYGTEIESFHRAGPLVPLSTGNLFIFYILVPYHEVSDKSARRVYYNLLHCVLELWTFVLHFLFALCRIWQLVTLEKKPMKRTIRKQMTQKKEMENEKKKSQSHANHRSRLCLHPRSRAFTKLRYVLCAPNVLSVRSFCCVFIQFVSPA